MLGQILRRRLPVAALVLVLCGCATPFSSDDSFNRIDTKAFIVFGLDDRVGMNEITFAKYDPVRAGPPGFWAGFEKYDSLSVSHRDGLRFVAGKWDPGFYSVAGYCYGNQTCVRLSPTLYFEVKPGKINYLGNTMLSRGAASHTGYTDELAKAYLANFKKVDADFERVEMHPTPGGKGEMEGSPVTSP